jgi:predicted nucleotide-binding protein
MVILNLSRKKVNDALNQRIEMGKSLRARVLRTRADLEAFIAEGERWHLYNIDLLRILFVEAASPDKYATEEIIAPPRTQPFLEQIDTFKAALATYINRLIYLRESLEIADLAHADPITGDSMDHQSVFLVHGKDDTSRETVARFMEKLNLKVIILHEQPSRGRTIIEKFEHGSQVGFAVALLTPDDVGAAKENPADLHPRARQNVIFELGYFCGALSRTRVCALYVEGVEIPSDFHGVVYIPLDSTGGWKLKLTKELLEAGMQANISGAL